MSQIKFHNTLSGKLDDFAPIKKEVVTLYTCGPTVYNYAHIGNFRTFAFEDLLRRFLEFKGFKVRHVMNITDVDDKTIAGAAKEKKTLQAYTKFYTDAFLEDMKTLNMLSPKIQPRATGSIEDIVVLIQKLIEKGIAYTAEDGSVYYRVMKFSDYGKLSKKDLEKNITGASERIDADEYESKEQVTDFVLWKASKEGEAELGAAWDSPWGKGRPGWHIECSAMCMRHLGETVDIHAGGEDLVFPHHENEIAQSEAATGKRFVNYWLHAKHLLVNGEKMSKSKGNFFTLRDLLAKGYDPMAIRYALLATHYRHSLNFTFDSLKEAKDAIEKMDNCYFLCLGLVNETEESGKGELGKQLPVMLGHIQEALEHDLNVSVALAAFLQTVSEINSHVAAKKMTQDDLKAALSFFQQADNLFGFDIASCGEVPSEVDQILKKYSEARKAKDFKQSDTLRQTIVEQGWLVKDGRPGEPSTVKKIRRTWDIKK